MAHRLIYLLIAMLFAVGASFGCDDDPADGDADGDADAGDEYEGDTPRECHDNVDNDLDGLVDCHDTGCRDDDICIDGDGDWGHQRLLCRGSNRLTPVWNGKS